MLTPSQSVLVELLRGLGETTNKLKLAKLEYLVDFLHYAFHSRPASGEGVLYERRQYGPLARSFNADLADLARLGLIRQAPRNYYALAGTTEPSLCPETQATLRYVLDRYGKLSTNELLALCHAQEPYLSTSAGAVIEFFTAYNLLDDHQDHPSA